MALVLKAAFQGTPEKAVKAIPKTFHLHKFNYYIEIPSYLSHPNIKSVQYV